MSESMDTSKAGAPLIGCGYGPIHDFLRRKYPDPLTDENRLAYYMEAAELYGQELRYAPELLPCNEHCPKCGSHDVHRMYRAKNETWTDDEAGDYRGKFAASYSHHRLTATKEHIAHHCRTCSHDWQGRPLPKAKR